VRLYSSFRCRVPDKNLEETGIFVWWTEHKGEAKSVQFNIANDERQWMDGNRSAASDGLLQGIRCE